MTAAELAQALGGAQRCGSTWMAWCPVHEGPRSTPSIAIAEGDGGRLVWRCHGGCTQDAVLHALLERGLLGGAQFEPDAEQLATARGERERDRRERIEAARGIWRHTGSGRGSLVETYLRARSIALPVPERLRVATLKHGPSGRRWPCMVGLVTDHADQVLGVHRTFLRRNGRGKAPVDPAKMSLGRIAGGSVRLAPVSHELLLAEGIESALAASELAGIGAWAALSANNLARLELPPDVQRVLVAADRDESRTGERAALEAARRWQDERRAVRVVLPARGFKDFADQLAALRARELELAS